MAKGKGESNRAGAEADVSSLREGAPATVSHATANAGGVAPPSSVPPADSSVARTSDGTGRPDATARDRGEDGHHTPASSADLGGSSAKAAAAGDYPPDAKRRGRRKKSDPPAPTPRVAVDGDFIARAILSYLDATNRACAGDGMPDIPVEAIAPLVVVSAHYVAARLGGEIGLYGALAGTAAAVGYATYRRRRKRASGHPASNGARSATPAPAPAPTDSVSQ